MSGEGNSNQINLTRGRSQFAARLALAAALTTGLSAAFTPQLRAQSASTAERSDADIQSDVAYALSNSRSLKGQPITAATVEGNVTVSGNVRDEASKELAESVISRVNGVHAVTNNLTVGDAAPLAAPPAQAAGGQTTPQSTEDKIAQQDPNGDLNYDPAQQNMAPVGPDNQAQGQTPGQTAPMPDPQGTEQYPAQRQPYNQQSPYDQSQSDYPQQPSAPVTISTGTLLQIRTSEPLDATRVQPGQVFQATVASDIYQGNLLAIPRGAIITGKVVATSSNKGDLAGRQGLSLALSSINLGGQSYSLASDTWSGEGPGKGGYSAGNTIGGAGLGAIIGAIAGGGAGAAIGAGVGGALGAGASAATTGPRMYLPVESVLNFHLVAPVTVTPVSAQEAQRLASSAYPRQPQPQLRPRPYGYVYPYGYPPPPPAYYYPYRYRYPVAYYPYYYYGYRR